MDTGGSFQFVKPAGVTKVTLYRHFPSKDDLIVAHLQNANAKLWEWLETAIRPREGSPRDQLIGAFEAVAKLTGSPSCYGCALENTAWRPHVSARRQRQNP